MHSLLSDIFRLLFDLDTVELSGGGGGGLLAFLAASWACNVQDLNHILCRIMISQPSALSKTACVRVKLLTAIFQANLG